MIFIHVKTLTREHGRRTSDMRVVHLQDGKTALDLSTDEAVIGLLRA